MASGRKKIVCGDQRIFRIEDVINYALLLTNSQGLGRAVSQAVKLIFFKFA
jgi:hypothetical protein